MRRVPMSASMHGLSALALIGLSASFATSSHASVDCASFRPLVPAKSGVLQLTPIAEELAAPKAQIGTGVGFAQLFSEGATVDVVLSRIQHQECRATAAAAAAQPLSGSYQPKPGETTAWRFDMTQNGKRMTADEFDAWMKARGVRVVKGPAVVAPPPPAPPAPAPEPPKKKKR
jgi:hypothetical protein